MLWIIQVEWGSSFQLLNWQQEYLECFDVEEFLEAVIGCRGTFEQTGDTKQLYTEKREGW